MAQLPSPDDRPDPSERMPAVRARVPEHVAIGQISTGVIVVTGATEYILDFVRNLPRPNMIVARVVLPHAVMPQFTEALSTNISLYRQRFGEIPMNPANAGPNVSQDKVSQDKVSQDKVSQDKVSQDKPAIQLAASSGGSAVESSAPSTSPTSPSNVSSVSVPGTDSTSPRIQGDSVPSTDSNRPGSTGSPLPPSSQSPSRHASPQEVYDDLKLRDELLSGAYANAVMIGHGPHEFCFDFITNFYPQSAVSCRVFMAAGHVGRLLESLKASWEQLRPRLGGNP